MVDTVTEDQFLVEQDTFDDVLGIVTERFATGARGFQTAKTETPALAKYEPFLKDAGSVEISFFGRAKTTGRFSIGAGRVVVNNVNGRFDRLKDRGIDGRDITVRERTGLAYPSQAPVRFSGITQTVTFSSLDINFNVRSKLNDLRTEAFQPVKFAGVGEVEGAADGIGGLPKPVILGDTSLNFLPILVDLTGREIYQISADPAEVDTVYTGRAVQTEGTVHTTLEDFLNGPPAPSPGTYDIYKGDWGFDVGNNERGTYISMGTTPSKVLTVDAFVDIVNILFNSNKYDESDWTKTNLTVSDQINTDPLGTLKATQVTEDGTAAVAHFFFQDVTIVADRFYTHSAYVKPNGRDQIRMTLGDTGATDTIEVDFTLTGTGTADTPVLSGVAANASANITLVDNGFYLIDVTGEINGSHTTLRHQINLLDSGGNPSYDGDSTSGIFIWQSQSEVGKLASPAFESPGAAISARKNSVGQVVFRVMDGAGFALDPLSVIALDQKNIGVANKIDGDAPVQHFQSTREVNPASIIDLLLNSIHAFLEATVDGKFKVGLWELPTAGESEITIDSTILLGTPKTRIIQIQDRDRGIPVFKVNIGYQENYTIMSETDIFGSAELTDIPFISQALRVSTDERSATKTKHLSSPEKNVDTKLTTSTDADDLVQSELDLYDTQREIIEIRIPRQFGETLELGDVFTLKSKLYRIIVKRLRFPNNQKRGITSQAITFQAWGGISV